MLCSFCTVEIAVEIEITTARAGAKLRAERAEPSSGTACHHLPAMPGPLALALLDVNRLPTHIAAWGHSC